MALPAEQLDIQARIDMDYEAAQRLAVALEDAWVADARSRITVTRQDNHRASSFGHKCDKQLYHDQRDWRTKRPVDETVQGFFDRGNDGEPIIERRLSNLGYRVIRSQVPLFNEELRVGMRSDGQIVEDQSGRPLIAEIKMTDNAKLLACRTVSDLWGDKWGRHYYTQTTFYMRELAIYAGVLICWDGHFWRPRVIPFPYDVAFSEQLADRARRINDHLDRNEPPDYTTDSRECRQCPHYGRACSPPISFGAGAQIITDDELLEDLERHAIIADAGREYATLDHRIKERLKGDKADPQPALFIVGPYEIHRTVGSRKGYMVQPSKPQKIEWERVT